MFYFRFRFRFRFNTGLAPRKMGSLANPPYQAQLSSAAFAPFTPDFIFSQ
jgi:hypothetical protein